jgi:S-adenosylmethionine-diacylglycerol 3-amino-3-carboxypropyl transferase
VLGASNKKAKILDRGSAGSSASVQQFVGSLTRDVPRRAFSVQIDQRIFSALYSRCLVYNACWEDPAIDRLALGLNSQDNVLVITSAGCNALDYALCAPRRIDAVDANPRQGALLELKLAGIRALSFPDFFALFGSGRHADAPRLYRNHLREQLSSYAREYWDRHHRWFCATNARNTFYHFGLSGRMARLLRSYICSRRGLAESIERAFAADDLRQQQRVYDQDIAPRLWTGLVNWILGRQVTMSMLGVPASQRQEVERQHAHGVPGFVREAVDYVFRQLPLASNYFWSLYLRGCYTAECCPEYLKEPNFEALKSGLANRIHVHTATVEGFLRGHDQPISKFVLLDHMDWMSAYQRDQLAEEWSAILQRAAPQARVLFRSAHAHANYLRDLMVQRQGRSRPLLRFLRLRGEMVRELQARDRVHTYAGLHIADIVP